MLFIIPGLIASYRYSLAFYILADDPSKGVNQCINESKQIMAGNKMALFTMQLTFIGWSILATLPVAIIAGVLAYQGAGPIYDAYGSNPELLEMHLNMMQLKAQNVAMLGGFGYLFFMPYMGVASACFYDLANGNLKIQRVYG